jgi:hypothetical protein
MSEGTLRERGQRAGSVSDWRGFEPRMTRIGRMGKWGGDWRVVDMEIPHYY